MIFCNKIKVCVYGLIFLGICTVQAQTVLQTFSCTGTGYTYVVPNNVCLIKIKAWGSGGGGGGPDVFPGGYGGGGGYAEAVVYVQPGDVLTIFPGCGGNGGIGGGSAAGGMGGYGLGFGGNGGNSGPSGGSGSGGGGGGSSAVSIGTNVVVVAPGGAGGGGGGCTSAGGNGGGGGSNGSGTSCVAAAGVAGGNFIKDGANGPSHSGDGGGAGGGGGGYTNGGSAGSVPPNGPSCNAANDCGASGGGGGNGWAVPAGGYPVVSSFTQASTSNMPANNTDPDFPNTLPNIAKGGNPATNGGSGYVVLIKLNASLPPVANINYNNPLCEKDTLKLVGSGGISYYWTGPNSFTSNIASPQIPKVSNVKSGYYTLLVQSADGCIDTAVRYINVKPLPPAPISNSPLCEGSNLNMSGSGAVSYTWTGVGGFASNSATVTINNISMSQAGNYYYFAAGSNGCVRKDTINVVVNPNPNAVINYTNISCYGYADGIAVANPTIGTSPFFYLWNNGSTNSQISNLPPNTYTVRVTDANNCMAFATVTITEPLPVTSTVSTKDLECYNVPTGSATINVSGGTGPYTYTWMPGNFTSSVISNVSAGNYIVQVLDAHNCLHTQTLTINQPPALQSIIQYTPVSCWGLSDGVVSATVSGGTSPLSYTWMPINNTNLTVNNVPAGVYTLNVSDAKNCTHAQTVQVTEPPPVLITTSPSQTICYGQSTNIYAFANGGNPPYSYTWSVGGFTSTGPYNVSPTSTTIYSVIAKDNNNCVSLPFTISVDVLPPLAGTNTLITTCDKDTVILGFTLTSPGNGGPYSYNWQNGTYTPTMLTVADFNNNPQTYTVIVSDGCTVPDASVAVTLSVHPLPKVHFTTDINSGCEPLNVQYTAISYGPNDQYQWTFDNGFVSTSTNVLVTYTSGIYSATLQVTDQYGCKMDTMSVKDVTVFPTPIANFSATPSVVSNVEPIVTFQNLSVGGTFFQWNFNDPYSLYNLTNEISPTHYFERPGEYEVALFVMNEFDCRDSIYKKVIVEYGFTVFIPNVFTPDGDGLNDVFNVKGIGISNKDFLMRIFNRWGIKIFETEDPLKGWDGLYDGELCPDGEYIYYIQLKPEISNKKNDIQTFQGKVFLFNKQKAPEY